MPEPRVESHIQFGRCKRHSVLDYCALNLLHVDPFNRMMLPDDSLFEQLLDFVGIPTRAKLGLHCSDHVQMAEVGGANGAREWRNVGQHHIFARRRLPQPCPV